MSIPCPPKPLGVREFAPRPQEKRISRRNWEVARKQITNFSGSFPGSLTERGENIPNLITYVPALVSLMSQNIGHELENSFYLSYEVDGLDGSGRALLWALPPYDNSGTESHPQEFAFQRISKLRKSPKQKLIYLRVILGSHGNGQDPENCRAPGYGSASVAEFIYKGGIRVFNKVSETPVEFFKRHRKEQDAMTRWEVRRFSKTIKVAGRSVKDIEADIDDKIERRINNWRLRRSCHDLRRFKTLPAEIRLRILYYAMGTRSRVWPYLAPFLGAGPKVEILRPGLEPTWFQEYLPRVRSHFDRSEGGVMGLLLANKTFSEEALEYFYRFRTFSFARYRHLEDWMCSLSPDSIRRIRRVELLFDQDDMFTFLHFDSRLKVSQNGAEVEGTVLEKFLALLQDSPQLEVVIHLPDGKWAIDGWCREPVDATRCTFKRCEWYIKAVMVALRRVRERNVKLTIKADHVTLCGRRGKATVPGSVQCCGPNCLEELGFNPTTGECEWWRSASSRCLCS